jgi:hypothetical protein
VIGTSGETDLSPISFTIPLKEAPEGVHTASTGTGTGTLTSGSKTVTSVVESTGIFVIGDAISGTGIPAGTTIVKAVPSGTLELSAAATASGSGVSLAAVPPPACDNGVAPAPSPDNPEADPGHFCVYLSYSTAPHWISNHIKPTWIEAAGKTGGIAAGETSKAGAVLRAEAEPNEFAWGTWAVTQK